VFNSPDGQYPNGDFILVAVFMVVFYLLIFFRVPGLNAAGWVVGHDLYFLLAIYLLCHVFLLLA